MRSGRMNVFLLVLLAFASALPTLDAPLDIPEWWVLGPIPVGTRESGYDPLWIMGGEENATFTGLEEIPSYFYPGGMVKPIKALAKNGEVSGKFEGVNLDAIAEHWGWAGTISVTYAYAEITLPEEKRALAVAEGIAGFYLNGRPYIGDVYAHGYVRVPVVLEKGVNRFLLRIGRAYEEFRFVFRLLPADSPAVILEKDAFFPSLYEGKRGEFPAAVPVVNTYPQWLENAVLSWGDNDLIQKSSLRLPPLPPLSITKFPISIRILRNPKPQELQEKKALIPVEVSVEQFKNSVVVAVPVEEPSAMHRETFVSRIDGAVGKYGIRFPQPYDPKKKYALIFALHGAGVDESLAGSYTPKDWAFVVSPLNRRPFGFDWQDWGRLDALEVLDLILKTYPIDEDRVYLTGHSMGGQGTWHIGIHHADRFAAIAPSAGWMSFHFYVPFFLRKSHLFSPPSLLHIWDKAMREIQTPAFLFNLSNIPVYIVQGEKDESVPPVHPRMMLSFLRSFGIESYYKEYPGQTHWFDIPETPYVDCVDFPELMKFFQMKKRIRYPRKVTFITPNPSINPRLYWVEISELRELYEDGEIQAEVVSPSLVRVQTRNIAEFSLFLSDFLPEGKVTILVDGKEFSTSLTLGTPASFHLENGDWRAGKKITTGLRKTPQFYGPIKQAFFQPFLLVYGTKGSKEHTQNLLRRAVHFANLWWWRASGFTRIVADTEVNEEMIRNYHLILFGGPEFNYLTARWMPSLPVQLGENFVKIGDKTYPGSDFSLQMIYPNPQNPAKFIVIFGGQSNPLSDLSSISFGVLFSGAGLPDFLLYRAEEVKKSGWAGITSAGFFDSSWSVSPTLLFLR
ncbi:MAG: carboxylesterase family protein [bacterium JZ-2024 1]